MGIFDSIFKPDTSATQQAYAQQRGYINQGKTEGLGYEKKALNKGKAPLNEAANIYGQFGQQFQPGIDTYLGSLGLTGQAGADAAASAYQTDPMLRIAEQGILRNRAALGGLNSGASYSALADTGAKYYGNWQDRLAGLINPAYQGMAGKAQTLKNLSDLISGNYENRANISLGAASNLANAAGQYGQNMQAADTAGTENFWNLALGLLGAGSKVAGAYATPAPVTNYNIR